MSDDRHQTSKCLDAETLAAFIDGRLEPRERAAVEAHLAGCEDCYEVWMEGSRESLAVTTTVRSSWRAVHWSAVARVAAAVVLLASATVWSLQFLKTQTPDLTELAESTRDIRPVRGRLSGGFAWAPQAEASRSATSVRPLSPDAELAAAKLRQAAELDRTPTNLAGAAVAYLVTGRVAEAIDALEEVVAVDGSIASPWSDLAAAYLERAVAGDIGADVPRAIQAANRALQVEPNHREALFNLAMAVEYMGDRDQAAAAWERYLAVDGTSAWATEVRSRLKELRDRPPANAPDAQTLRDRLFDELLPAWSDTPRNSRDLAPFRSAVAQLATFEADHLATDVVMHAVQIAERGGDRLAALDVALRTYREARRMYASANFPAAREQFLAAEQRLAAIQSPLGLLAEVHRGICEYRSGDLPAASATMEAVLAHPDSKRAASVAGQAESNLGLIASYEIRRRESLEHYQRARIAFERSGEMRRMAFVDGLIATQYDLLGDTERAWATRLRALTGSRRTGTWLAGADAATRLGWHFVARLMQDVAIDIADAAKSSPELADALRLSAVTLASVGDATGAHVALKRASELRAAIPGDAGVRVSAELDVAEATVAGLLRSGEDAGLQAADRAIRYFEGMNAGSRLPAILLAKARIQIAVDARQDARKTIVQALQIRHDSVAGLPNATGSATVGDVSRDLLSLLVAIDDKAQTPFLSLPLLNLSRGVGLPRHSGLPPTSAEGLQARLPPNLMTLTYLVTPSTTYIWAMTATDRRFSAVVVSADRLASLVRDASAGKESVRQSLRSLLLGPIADVIPPNASLAIQPDGPLHDLPFALLPGRHSAFLVQEHASLVVPYLDLAIPETVSLEHVLVVGDPWFSPARFPGLPRLPFASEEARDIAALYGQAASLLDGHAPVRDQFLSALRDATIVHFGGHTLINPGAPEYSRLVIGGPDADAIDVKQLDEMRLGSKPVVVLAACDGATGFSTASEGPISIARAFLRAGATAVLASRTAVPDGRIRPVMLAFHKALRRTGNVAEALQSAQLEALDATATRADTTWAQLVVVTTSFPPSSQRSH